MQIEFPSRQFESKTSLNQDLQLISIKSEQSSNQSEDTMQSQKELMGKDFRKGPRCKDSQQETICSCEQEFSFHVVDGAEKIIKTALKFPKEDLQKLQFAIWQNFTKGQLRIFLQQQNVSYMYFFNKCQQTKKKIQNCNNRNMKHVKMPEEIQNKINIVQAVCTFNENKYQRIVYPTQVKNITKQQILTIKNQFLYDLTCFGQNLLEIYEPGIDITMERKNLYYTKRFAQQKLKLLEPYLIENEPINQQLRKTQQSLINKIDHLLDQK